MPEQSPLFVKVEALMPWMLAHTAKFPNAERARLARQIETTLFALHSHLVYAAKTDQTKTHLSSADAELEKLRFYLRLSVEMRYTSFDQYAYCAGQLNEIGNLLGAWIKKASASRDPAR